MDLIGAELNGMPAKARKTEAGIEIGTQQQFAELKAKCAPAE